MKTAPMKYTFFVILFCLPFKPSLAVDLATAIEAYKFFDRTDRLGGISCVAHLGANQCRNFKRCGDGLGYVKALANGLPSAAKDLDSWMGKSSLTKNCGYSLLGGNTSAIFTNFQYLADFAQEHGGGEADSMVKEGRISSSDSQLQNSRHETPEPYQYRGIVDPE